RLMPEEGLIDWHNTVSTVHNLVRAVDAPWHGAFSYNGSQKFTIWSSRICPDAQGALPGSVISVSPLRVACAVGALEIIT
ncbi:bifunctional UDP-4-amino-4-deoxy-L-arabinose formyltransferase/UDP-glucuronic acid oxidase ArnA, partial [Salmonella enterica subsp. enterica serovar Infantis]